MRGDDHEELVVRRSVTNLGVQCALGALGGGVLLRGPGAVGASGEEGHQGGALGLAVYGRDSLWPVGACYRSVPSGAGASPNMSSITRVTWGRFSGRVVLRTEFCYAATVLVAVIDEWL